MGIKWSYKKTTISNTTDQETEPFQRINLHCLVNILILLSEPLQESQTLQHDFLYLLFVEARKMGGHNVDYIIRSIEEKIKVTITKKECENLVSYIGLFLPFEAEMETIEEDFEFVRQRCNIFLPPTHLLGEWTAHVKLMEKNIRIARGYVKEKPLQITRYSSSFAYRFSKNTPKKIQKKNALLKPLVKEFQQLHAELSSQQSDDTVVSPGISTESGGMNSPRIHQNVVNYFDDEESKSFEETSSSPSSIVPSNPSSPTHEPRNHTLRMTHPHPLRPGVALVPERGYSHQHESLECIEDVIAEDSEESL
jgi:hypothetical protein